MPAAPLCLIEARTLAADRDGLALIDLRVEDGRIASILPAGTEAPGAGPELDLDGGIVLPRLVDSHIHLDKGHIWPRRRNPDGTFMGALDSVMAGPRGELVGRRRARAAWISALRCAFAHGTGAIRTHLDSLGKQIAISWPVFAEMRGGMGGPHRTAGVAAFRYRVRARRQPHFAP